MFGHEDRSMVWSSNEYQERRTSLQGFSNPAVTAERSPSAADSSSLLGMSSSSSSSVLVGGSWDLLSESESRYAPYANPTLAEITATIARISVSQINGVAFARDVG